MTAGPWARRILRATLPSGVALLIVWIVYVVVALVIGNEQFGLTIVHRVGPVDLADPDHERLQLPAQPQRD